MEVKNIYCPNCGHKLIAVLYYNSYGKKFIGYECSLCDEFIMTEVE